MDPDYAYWEKALADPKALHAREFSITTEPQAGFFRTKFGYPVAIWRDPEFGMLVLFGYDDEPKQCDDDLWTRVAKYPVSEEEYRNVVDLKQEWSDRDEVIRATLGHNIKDATDFDTLSEMIGILSGECGKYIVITDDDQAKRAISLRNRLNELKLQADKIRKDEKEPHLKAGKQVDDLWQPIVKTAERNSAQLVKSVGQHETAKLQARRREEDARRKLEDEERARGASAGQATDAFGLPPVAPIVDQVRPGYGKAASIREKLVVTRIVDVRNVAAQFADNEELHALLIKLAQRAIDDGHQVSYIESEMQAVVR